MKKTRFLAVLAAGAIMLSGCNGNKELKKEAMKIGDVKITAGDIAVLTDVLYSQYEVYAQYGQEAQVEFSELRDDQVNWVEKAVKYGELAKAMGIEITEEEEEAAIATRAQLATMKGGYEDFEKYVEDNGSSIKSLDRIFISSMYASKLTEQVGNEIAKKQPTDEDFKKHYEENYYCAKHILVSESDDAEKFANELLKKAKAGEDFDAMIAEHSEDPGSTANPDGYVFAAGQMVKPFEDTVKNLKVGEFGICKSERGYHVILRLALPAYEEQQVMVEQSYSDVELNKRIEDLLKKHKIEVTINQSVIDGITQGVIVKEKSNGAQQNMVPSLTEQ